jgi:hypothetical protein
MKKLLTLKHWQLFGILVGVPAIFQLIVFVAIIKSNDPTIIFTAFPILMLLFVGLFLGWFYLLGTNLHKKLPQTATVDLKKFKLFLFIPVALALVFSIFMIVMGSTISPDAKQEMANMFDMFSNLRSEGVDNFKNLQGGHDKIVENMQAQHDKMFEALQAQHTKIAGSFPVNPFIFALIVPLNFIAMFCIVYCLYFIAKVLKTVELQRPVRFGEFARELFLIWFFPIGIWIIQPRINKLFAI